MDTLVSSTGLSSSGKAVHFPDSLRLIVPYNERFVALPSRTLQPLDHFFYIKASADWFHRITNYNLWQLICFCSRLQMPWGNCQSVRAHSHHIIFVQQLPAQKNMLILHSRENIYGNKIKKTNQLHRFGWFFVKDGTYFVIGAVLPSGQNPLATEEEKKSLLLCFFDVSQTKT